jgi:hypothetical protein
MHPIRPPPELLRVQCTVEEGEALKITQRARNDLEAFADEWKGLKERKQYIELSSFSKMSSSSTAAIRPVRWLIRD